MADREVALSSDIIFRLMFDYERLSREEMSELCRTLTPKLIRWVAMHHPDNRSRLLFYELTNVPIGEGTVINADVTLYDDYQGLIRLGKRVAVSSGVTLVASSYPNNSHLSDLPYVRDHLIRTAPVAIGDDAWLGTRAVVLPGITVGGGAIVGAGSVVTVDVAPRTVVAGVPARLIRRLG